MKSLIKRFTAVITAVIIFCFSVVPVSAAVSDLVLPDSGLWQYAYGDDLAINIIDQFYSNPSVANLGYTKDNSYLSVSYNTANSWYVFCCVKFDNAVYGDFICGDGDGVFITSSSLIYATLRFPRDDISSYSFSQSSNNIYSTFNNISGIAYLFSKKIYSFFTASYTSNGYDSWQSSSSYSKFLFYYDKPLIFESSDNTVLPLGIDVESFFNWYMSTNERYKNQLYGVEQGSNFKIFDDNLKYLLDYFNEYGADLSCFYSHYPELLPCYKNPDFVGPPSRNDFINLFTILKQHYNFYLKSKSMILPTVKPNVTEDDTTLITDIDVDTVDISLLREILRILINIYNRVNDIDLNFNAYTSNVFFKLDTLIDNLDNKDIDFDFSADADRIITAINNINIPSGGSSTDISLDVTITDDKQQEINDFFQDWNVRYTEKINDKIPVVGQLSSLFNDSFFEKCGIDVDGDGEVYQYYNTNRSMTLYDLPVPVQDAGTTLAASSSAATSDEFMDSFVGQFDGADAHFLDDVYFTEDVPAFYVTIGGKKTEIFDFKLFAKYRTQVHTIMIFCICSLYFLSLYKSLPTILGNVADVADVFRSNSDHEE